jgi:hypothetical protein
MEGDGREGEKLDLFLLSLLDAFIIQLWNTETP